MRAAGLLAATLIASLLAVPAAAAEGPAATSCVACHGSSDWFDEESVALVEGYARDVHAEVGLSCHDCHGGNPDPVLAEDLVLAMDPAHEPNPYLGVPERTAIPASCGRCHSDPTYMRRFKPDVRVDQEREYATSQHGMALAQGDTKVATCVDCHGVHGILRPGDPESPVYPTRVAATCGGCHSDPERMEGYTLEDGRPLPIDQLARWRRSVHAASLFEKNDLSAPTCNDCHGNHGAVPPGFESVAFVCGACHGRETELFRASPKEAGFALHSEYLADAGPDGCAACHEAPEPQAELAATSSTFFECASCHGNHAIVRPTVAMLAPLPETPCAFCHGRPEGVMVEVAEPEAQQRRFEEMLAELLADAEAQGLTGEERFDFLVDRSLGLPAHTVAAAGEGGEPGLKQEFAELFRKFRIGKTHFTYDDPVTGEPVREPVVRCSDCHAEEPLLADEGVGLAASAAMLGHSRELTALAARAQRIVLRARRGGVETREALEELEGAVDAQIELEVLVHGFASGEGSAFQEKFEEGRGHAVAALGLGEEALEELGYRRRGLAVALGVIAVLLVGLGLKIRGLSG